MRTFFRNNGLSLTLLGLFFLCILGQSLTGLRRFNDEQREAGAREYGYWEYLASGDFVEAVFENWESEFLQMGLFVLLTAFLYQKGSPQSNPLPGEKQEPRTRVQKDSPGPVHRGGRLLRIYSHSLSAALFLLFAISFALHALGGTSKYNHEQVLHGQETVTVLGYIGSSRFWYESFQNWQSEFLSVAVIVLLSIVLRERDSQQSKDVAAPHGSTGG